jgi:UDP-N-acetylmuramate: L-alanyl-gamma-D-glutamyl-meso-diaminopimelate ligase
MRIHVIAVAGTGMGALAGLLVELGHEVSGSDVSFDPPMGPALRAWGIRCLEGFDPAHLDPAPDLVVVGNVCRRDNPEVVAARERALDLTHIAGALQRFALPGTTPLVVAGTHGKTTTSTLAAWLLDATGCRPGFLVGGLPKNFDRSFRSAGESSVPSRPRPFVIEGDEYDTAYFEKTAKFLHYRAEVAIVTSIEHDHIDIYPTLDSYLEAFRRFVAQIPASGLVVAHAGDPTVVSVVQQARARVVWFALQDEPTAVAASWTAAPAAADFDLFVDGVASGRWSMTLPGRHNVRNALAALAALREGYGVPLPALRAALPGFAGVRRRQDLIGTPFGIHVYDDFAHHPTAVRETLLALRTRHPQGSLFAVFEPRSATACRNLHQAEYAEAFDHADEVLLAPLGRPNISESERLDVDLLARELRGRGKPAEACASTDRIIARLVAEARPGDAIALLSNGAFGGIHRRLLEALDSSRGG